MFHTCQVRQGDRWGCRYDFPMFDGFFIMDNPSKRWEGPPVAPDGRVESWPRSRHFSGDRKRWRGELE